MAGANAVHIEVVEDQKAVVILWHRGQEQIQLGEVAFVCFSVAGDGMTVHEKRVSGYYGSASIRHTRAIPKISSFIVVQKVPFNSDIGKGRRGVKDTFAG